MDTLFESLATLKDRPIGTVLHIGAGNGLVLARYADLAPEQIRAQLANTGREPEVAAAMKHPEMPPDYPCGPNTNFQNPTPMPIAT